MFLVLWFTVILAASVMPVSGPATKLPLDKIVHAFMYGATAVLLCRHFLRTMTLKKAQLLSILTASAYGGVMECIQYFLPRRSFEIGDMAANTAGAVIFSTLYAVLTLHRRGRNGS